MEDEITTDDIESTYKVLEAIRDVWLPDDYQSAELVGNVHCIVQEYQLAHEDELEEPTDEITLEREVAKRIVRVFRHEVEKADEHSQTEDLMQHVAIVIERQLNDE
jgi:cell division ATPase FtsA